MPIKLKFVSHPYHIDRLNFFSKIEVAVREVLNHTPMLLSRSLAISLRARLNTQNWDGHHRVMLAAGSARLSRRFVFLILAPSRARRLTRRPGKAFDNLPSS